MAQKAQRIKMQREGSPVRLDGTVTAWTLEKFTVSFDGPIEDTTFFPHGGDVVTEGESSLHANSSSGLKFWRVLS